MIIKPINFLHLTIFFAQYKVYARLFMEHGKWLHDEENNTKDITIAILCPWQYTFRFKLVPMI